MPLGYFINIEYTPSAMSLSISDMRNKIKENNILIVIGGPTASGKTSLAVALAHHLQGQIISADSRQIYKGLTIGSGKDLDEYTFAGKSIPYHCIDIASPEEVFTLFDYLIAAKEALEKIKQSADVPILCGGTGLYIEALLKDYQIPPVKEDIDLRLSLKNASKEELLEKLSKLSLSLANKTDCTSKKRLIRAIEIATYTNALPSQTKPSSAQKNKLIPFVILTDFSKENLIKRIDNRVEQRLKEGMIDEVKQLIDNGITLNRLTQLGMEYGTIGSYLFNKTDYNEMVLTLKNNIHRLAKRQRTWFRGTTRRGIKTHTISGNSFDEALELITEFLNHF